MTESLSRRLAAWTLPLNLVLVAVALSAAGGGNDVLRVDEVEAERLTIVEPDGRVRMVIANRARTPGPIEHGAPFGYGAGQRAGMIFYNDEYTEAGGLVISGAATDTPGEPLAVGSLTFDQFNRDQTIALQYVENNGRRRAGMAINDHPGAVTSAELDAEYDRIQAMTDSAGRAEAMAAWRQHRGRNRLFLGRQFDGHAVVVLGDEAGRPLLRLAADSLAGARIEFLGPDGEVVRTIRAVAD